MNDRQENKLGMFRATGKVLTNNNTVFAGVPAMVTQHQNLLDSIALIDALAQAQDAVTTGITVDKKTFRDQMASYAMRVAGALKAYASTEGNATLLHKADISDTSFTRARDDQRDDIAQGVHDDATGVLAALADYGVTAPTLAALQTRIDSYRLAIANPKLATADRSMHTTLLKQEFDRADMIVKDRLDGLVRQFEETNPAFVLAYENARKITDTGSKGSGGTPTPPPTPPTPPNP